MDHGLAGLNERCKVQDGVEWLVLPPGGCEDFFEGLPVGQLALNEFDSGGQQLAPAVA